MKYLIILILLLLFSSPARAGFHVGTSLTVLGADDITPSYNIGYSKSFKSANSGSKTIIDAVLDDLVLDFTTNAFYPTESEFNKKGFGVKSKVTYGAFFVGKKFNRCIPSLFAALVKVDNKIYYGDINIDNYDNKAVVFGGNVTYFVTENIAGSAFVLLPNTNIDSKYSVGLGVNWYF